MESKSLQISINHTYYIRGEKHNNIKFELVPAYKNWGTYYIPDGKGGWMPTYPNDFNNTLTETNNNNSYKIKPLVRLIKHWNVNVNYRDLTS